MNYDKTYELWALAIKQEKLAACIMEHDQYRDADVKAWEIAELARTQLEFKQLNNTYNNGKDQTNQNNSKQHY
jgi:hypothetical protein